MAIDSIDLHVSSGFSAHHTGQAELSDVGSMPQALDGVSVQDIVAPGSRTPLGYAKGQPRHEQNGGVGASDL
jgi:hypothetical protein